MRKTIRAIENVMEKIVHARSLAEADRRGRPMPDIVEIIHQMREDRSKQLAGLPLPESICLERKEHVCNPHITG